MHVNISMWVNLNEAIIIYAMDIIAILINSGPTVMRGGGGGGGGGGMIIIFCFE